MNYSENKIIFQAAESPPEAEDICGESSFFAALSREFYKVVGPATNNGREADKSNNGIRISVVGQAMRQRRTSYARGGQVTPKAHKFRQRRTGYARGAQVSSRLSRDEQVPTTAGVL
jgi:hypothetical protein